MDGAKPRQIASTLYPEFTGRQSSKSQNPEPCRPQPQIKPQPATHKGEQTANLNPKLSNIHTEPQDLSPQAQAVIQEGVPNRHRIKSSKEAVVIQNTSTGTSLIVMGTRLLQKEGDFGVIFSTPIRKFAAIGMMLAPVNINMAVCVN